MQFAREEGLWGLALSWQLNRMSLSKKNGSTISLISQKGVGSGCRTTHTCDVGPIRAIGLERGNGGNLSHDFSVPEINAKPRKNTLTLHS